MKASYCWRLKRKRLIYLIWNFEHFCKQQNIIVIHCWWENNVHRPVIAVVRQSVASIREFFFKGCASSATWVGSSFFCGCRSHWRTELQPSVAPIGSCVFNSCHSLMEFASLVSVGHLGFKVCRQLAEFAIPGQVFCFSHCASLSRAVRIAVASGTRRARCLPHVQPWRRSWFLPP